MSHEQHVHWHCCHYTEGEPETCLAVVAEVQEVDGDQLSVKMGDPGLGLDALWLPAVDFPSDPDTPQPLPKVGDRMLVHIRYLTPEEIEAVEREEIDQRIYYIERREFGGHPSGIDGFHSQGTDERPFA